MQMSPAAAPIYHDFQGLSALRSQANSAPDEALGEVAAQFESLFVQIMLKAMREATIDGGLFDSDQMEMYQSMFDQQLSLGLSSQGALGLSDLLVDELAGSGPATQEPGGLESLAPEAHKLLTTTFPVMASQPLQPRIEAVATKHDPQGAPAVSSPARGPVRQALDNNPEWQPASPEEYVSAVWDDAVAAASEVGLDPLVLVAQSALETGWGKRVIQAVDGSSSFNMFGVKADVSWQGATAAVKSLEFRDGVAALEKASFRAYESISGSFRDYVGFLQDNPRYQQALKNVADSKAFLYELQDAGYATDPVYADKILGIIDQISGGMAAR